MACSSDGAVSNTHQKPPLALSGPMWTGPLHNTGDIRAMQSVAAAKGWAGGAAVAARTKKNAQKPLESLLQARCFVEKVPRCGCWVDDCEKILLRYLAST